MSGASTVRSGSWLLVDTGSAAVIAFGFFVVTARVLTPLEFGIAALFVSVAQVLLPTIDTLFHDAVIQREGLDEHDVRTAMTATLVWGVVVASVLLLVTPALANLIQAPELATYLPWLTPAILFSSVAAVPTALMRRTMSFRSLAIRTVTARVAATLIGLALLYVGAGIWAVVAQAVLSVVLASSLLLVMVRPSLRLGIDRLRFLNMLRFAAPAMGTQLLLFAGSRIVTLLVSALLGPVSAGVWNVALRFVEPLQIMAATLVGQLMLPIYSRNQTDLPSLRRLFLEASRRAGSVLVPMFVGLAVCAPQVVQLFVGERWADAALPMSIICIAFAVIASRQLVEIALTALGAPQLNFLVQVAALGLSLVGLIVGAKFGLIEGTLGWSLRALPFVTLAALFLRRRAGIGYRDQMLAIAPAAAASFVMATAVLCVRGASTPYGSLVSLVIEIAVGVLVYATTLLVLDAKTRREIVGTLQHIRHSRISP